MKKIKLKKRLQDYPCVKIGEHVLYHGDAFEIMPLLGEVDHVITDPPYSERTQSSILTNDKRVRSKKVVLEFKAFTIQSFVNLVLLSTEIANHWSIFFTDNVLGASTLEMSTFIRLGIWVKTNPMPSFNSFPAQGYEHILLHYNRSQRVKWNGGGKRAVWTGPKVEKKAVYQTQKPDWLLNRLVADFVSLKESQTVLDPMMGSGTTGVAVAKTQHRFIGIDRDPVAFKLACERVASAASDNLFFR